jgi:hypothetical protein
MQEISNKFQRTKITKIKLEIPKYLEINQYMSNNPWVKVEIVMQILKYLE